MNGAESFMPHGGCFLWEPTVLWPFVLGNIGVATAYLIGFPWAWRRVDFFGRFTLLLAFVVFCGLGHLLQAWNVWKTDYALEGWWLCATAVVSWLFVITSERHRTEAEKAIMEATLIATDVGDERLEGALKRVREVLL